MILVGFFLHLTGLWSVKWNLYGLRNFPGLWCGLESQLCSPACFHYWKGEERKMTLEKKLISIWQVCVCVCVSFDYPLVYKIKKYTHIDISHSDIYVPANNPHIAYIRNSYSFGSTASQE